MALVLMVLGFIWWWPVGLILLGFLIARGGFGCWRRPMLAGNGPMGGFDHHVTGEGTPGAPTVRIRGFSLWGGVGIRRKNRKAQR